MCKLGMSVIAVDHEADTVKFQVQDVRGRYAYATLDYNNQTVQVSGEDAGRLAGCFNSMHLISLITAHVCLIDDLSDFYIDRLFFLA